MSKMADNLNSNDLSSLLADLALQDSPKPRNHEKRRGVHTPNKVTKRRSAGTYLPADNTIAKHITKYLKIGTRVHPGDPMDLDVPETRYDCVPMDIDEPEPREMNLERGSSTMSETRSVEVEMTNGESTAGVVVVPPVGPRSGAREDVVGTMYARWKADPRVRLHLIPGVHRQLEMRMRQMARFEQACLVRVN
ncbi:hypothetical protein CkaCkLH20_10198 [Colletotrichum karsti]|uniref:Uncharacterized protein n=1 Tax=Colletotrichum karsti TaxID=1095194 RepID=A0A9P6LGN2_9PEZI|nr:uncharacterized protein CkaCkLH20_10198 [Colletotrichum karsti]KAF9872371.1 hypothetical protein CkaCkLH20_10198 [Colletotrichum karsti]